MPLCDGTAANGGMCWTHYNRTRRGRTPLLAPIAHKRRGDEVCAFPDCGGRQTRGDWCDYHYWQAFRGRTLTPRQRRTGTPTSWGECCLPRCETRARAGALACQRHRALARKYGLSEERLLEVWGDGSCNACGSTKTEPHLDHDHSCCGSGGSCGRCVRGVLCRGCNSALGHLEDDPGRVRALEDYLLLRPRS